MRATTKFSKHKFFYVVVNFMCLFSHIIKRRKLCLNFIQILSLFIPAARATTAGAGTPFEVWKRRAGEGFRCSACGEDVDLGAREEENTWGRTKSDGHIRINGMDGRRPSKFGSADRHLGVAI